MAAPIQLGVALEMWVGENGEYRYQQTVAARLNVADDDMSDRGSQRGERLPVGFAGCAPGRNDQKDTIRQW